MKYYIELVKSDFSKILTDKRNDELRKNIEQFINTQTEDCYNDNEDYNSLHSVIPIYDEENEIEKYVFVFKDDEKRYCVNIINESKEETYPQLIRESKLSMIMACNKIIYGGVKFNIIDKIFNLEDDVVDLICKYAE